MNFKAAIFDMDGTLIDSLMFWDFLWAELGTRFLGDSTFAPTAEDDKRVRTTTLQGAMQLIHDNYHLGDNGDHLLKIAEEMVVDFYSHTVTLKRGVKEFLEHLKSQNIPMCVASATAKELVMIALEHCGIADYFSAVFSCADLGKGKDKPDIYLLTAQYLGHDTDDVCVFEDSLVAIETATGIGMPTVAIYDRFNYGQERMKAIATAYIAEGETLLKLVK